MVDKEQYQESRTAVMIVRFSLTAVAFLCLTALHAQAADTPITRTPLQAIEAPETAHSVQSYLVTVAPHAMVPRHTHPGVEPGYIVSGAMTVSLADQPDRVVKSGDSWAFANGAPHSLLNTGDAPAQLVVTYVVEQGKPLSSSAL
jgi:quercetin dioxygenase-like cupin family protein